MDNDVNRIFKNEMIGQPQLQKVLRNRIRGVSGEIISIVPKPRDNPEIPNIINVIERRDIYTYIFKQTKYEINSATADIDYIFNSNYNLNFSYANPVRNVKITADLVYIRKQNTTGALDEASRIIGFIGNNPSHTLEKIMGEEISFPDVTLIESQEFIPCTVKINFITKFEVNFNIILNTSLTGKMIGNWMQMPGQPPVITAFGQINIIKPLFIEVKIRADTTESLTQQFIVGESTNAFKFPQNSLITTKSTKDGIPLYQFLSNKIINEWHDGKQITNLAKIINNNQDLEQKNTDVKIMNTREESFIDDSQSFSRHPDGTARVFKIDSADVVYDGSLRQTLDISEKI